MTNDFDKQRHRKAFIYTAAICSLLLIAFIFISWKTEPPAPPVITELIEVNLGDNNEGLGEEEPMIKGTPAPPQEETAPTPPAQQESTNEPAVEEKVTPDDNAEETAAPVPKPVVKNKPVKNPTPAPTPKPVAKPTTAAANPSPKPTPAPKPRFTMPGAKGPGGNNAKQDNGYTQQGNNPKGGGNKGVPGGNPDTYGTKPGGSIDGAKVTKGNRKIINIRPYKFPGDLERATIYADIRVSPDGNGSFIKFSQGSTSTSPAYASAIRGYLQNMKFDAADDDGVVTVRFNFNVD